MFKNLAPGKSGLPLRLSGPYSWNTDPLLPCNITKTQQGAGQKQLILSSSSIAGTMFYWLKVTVNSTWGIDPSNWLEVYENEFVPIQ